MARVGLANGRVTGEEVRADMCRCFGVIVKTFAFILRGAVTTGLCRRAPWSDLYFSKFLENKLQDGRTEERKWVV